MSIITKKGREKLRLYTELTIHHYNVFMFLPFLKKINELVFGSNSVFAYSGPLVIMKLSMNNLVFSHFFTQLNYLTTFIKKNKK